MPLVEEDGSEVARAAKDDKVKVEIDQFDGIKVVELETEENIDGGRVVEVTGVGGRLEKGWRWAGGEVMMRRGRILRVPSKKKRDPRERGGFHFQMAQMGSG